MKAGSSDGARWPDGTLRSAGNAFSRALGPVVVGTPAEAAWANSRSKRSAAQVLAPAKNHISIGTQADAGKRSRLRKASI
jgi:hypothetical protein